MSTLDSSAKQRFWSKVDCRGPDECWEWQAYRMPKGYGQFGVSGKVYLTHRIAYELEYGPIPEGMFVCHRCDNPPCVNPSHLWLGSVAENQKDAARKGRMPRGLSHTFGRLGAENVIMIRKLVTQGVSQAALARHFGVAHTTIGKAVRRQTYGWVE